MKKVLLFFVKIFAIFSFFSLGFFSSYSLVSADDASTGFFSNSQKVQSDADAFLWPIKDKPTESIEVAIDAKSPLLDFLKKIQNILLKLVLPVVAVGCGIYIAYNLFTAEGDESKMASTWRAILYSAIAIISIGLSAMIVGIISGLTIG